MPSRSRVPASSSKNRSGPNASGSVSQINTTSTTNASNTITTNSSSTKNPAHRFTPSWSTPSNSSTSSTKKSSHHKSRSSFSSGFFSSSPSSLWRRGPELESFGSSDMTVSPANGKKTGSGEGAVGGGKRTDAPRSPRFWQKNYLVAYNLVSAVLWATILGRVLLMGPIVGKEHVHAVVGEYAKWVQTGALLEVLHSVTGTVRAPLVTTLMQVASRILLVWGVVDRHPDDTSPSIFYSTMLIAWSVTEVIRYGYFVMSLKGSGPVGVPRFLTWLRYNTFFVLYPTGITSEVVMVWKASLADDAERLETFALWAILGIYVPGSYILYTHMMKQRRKIFSVGSPARPRVDSVKDVHYKR